MLKNLLHLFPKPDLIFLVDVPEEIAYQRKDDVPSMDYLKVRRNSYLDIGEGYDMRLLDGCKDLTELKERVQKEVFEYMEEVT
jgi:dTMP kinase